MITSTRDAPVAEAVRVLTEHNVGALVVTDQAGEIHRADPHVAGQHEGREQHEAEARTGHRYSSEDASMVGVVPPR